MRLLKPIADILPVRSRSLTLLVKDVNTIAEGVLAQIDPESGLAEARALRSAVQRTAMPPAAWMHI
jgi:hypothetical protein